MDSLYSGTSPPFSVTSAGLLKYIRCELQLAQLHLRLLLHSPFLSTCAQQLMVLVVVFKA